MAIMTPQQAQIAAQGIQTTGNFMSELFFNNRRKKEAELAYQRQVDFWNMQNEYNSPASQMARYKAAGLNPNLIYGQGNPGNATSTPNYNPPSFNAPKLGSIDFLGIAQMVQQMHQSKAQIDLIEQQRQNLRVEEENKRIYGNVLNIKAIHDNLKYGFDKETFGYRTEGLSLKNQLTTQTIENMRKMYEKLGHDIDYARERAGYQSELTRLAKSGLGLRSPSSLESALNSFLEGLTGNGINKFVKKAGEMSKSWKGGFFNPTKPFFMLKELFSE